MHRYIDADKIELLWYVPDAGYLTEWQKAHNEKASFAQALLDRAKTEDVAPVVHAHWKEFEDYSGTVYPECSRCGLVWWLEEGTAEDNEMFYCPKCGAKMDEETNDGS